LRAKEGLSTKECQRSRKRYLWGGKRAPDDPLSWMSLHSRKGVGCGTGDHNSCGLEQLKEKLGEKEAFYSIGGKEVPGREERRVCQGFQERSVKKVPPRRRSGQCKKKACLTQPNSAAGEEGSASRETLLNGQR